MGGYVSFSGSVDCSVVALEVAKIKIAVVNRSVPHTYGDALIPLIPLSISLRITGHFQSNCQ